MPAGRGLSRGLGICSVGFATDIDVLPDGAIAARHDGYVVVRTPTNPDHYWGNFLLFDRPPDPGDRARWEQLFDAEIGVLQPSSHFTFAWDRIDGALGAACEELEAAGYEIEGCVTLVVDADGLVEAAAAQRPTSADVEIIALDPADGADAALWEGAVAVQASDPPPGHALDAFRAFCLQRTIDRRRRFAAGDGAWYVALRDGAVVAGCGVVVTEGRGRFQAVDTHPQHRRRGIASMLVHAAARDAIDRLGARELVIVAEQGNHAQRLYESLGFEVIEQTCGASWWPTAPRADLHPGR